jgi:MoxR-like ATPase
MRTLHAAWEAGAEAIFLSKEDDAEAQRYLPILKSASLFECPFPTLIAVSNLVEAWQKIKFGAYADPAHLASIVPFYERRNISSEGLLSLRPELEKWVQIAAAGLHHLLLLGPRGAGKSHAFEWLIRLQPEASAEIQVRQILIRELLGSEKIRLDSGPPIRRVGTQVRSQALYGGSTGGTLKPGEFSLAHGGVLLADELPEWPRDSREALREPLERGVVTLTRTQSTAELPAQFVLAANGNLCPCGGWPRLLRKAHVGIPLTHFRCSCKDSEVIAYLKRLSGPILDRIDIIQLVIPRSPDERELTSVSLSFAQLRERIAHAQDLGRKLWGLPPGLLPASEVEMILKDYPAWREALDHRKELGLRSRHKIARIALSLAIYESVGAKQNSSMPPLPSERHFEEAFYMRPEGIQIQV